MESPRPVSELVFAQRKEQHIGPKIITNAYVVGGGGGGKHLLDPLILKQLFL